MVKDSVPHQNEATTLFDCAPGENEAANLDARENGHASFVSNGFDGSSAQNDIEPLMTSLCCFNNQKPIIALNARMLENRSTQLSLQEKQLALKEEFIALQAGEVKLLSDLVDDFSAVIVGSKLQASAIGQPKRDFGVLSSHPMRSNCQKENHAAFLKNIQVATSSLKPLEPNVKRTTHDDVWDTIRKKFRNVNNADDE
ncbi:hypothetical protein BC833DRAFT_637870 [Globomyces pollinis-pini]|nr:hypothetical protein BC833DRAFT_637870 [Globomyces pollinis-pini]